MALTSADLARLGPQAQKQVLDKLVGEQKSKKSKYGNRKVVRDGIKFDSDYAEDIAKVRAAKAEEKRQTQAKDDYLGARQFKTRRGQKLRK